MKYYFVRIVMLCLIGYFPAECFADGTVDFKSQVIPIINQRPFFANFLNETFEFQNSAVAVTIGSNVSSELGLTRIGPYRVCAKMRNDKQANSCAMEVVIDTNTHFFNKDGKEIDGPEGAVSVKEDFLGIEVNPPSN
ncbi:hypothetical protein [Paraburkholderia bannensis]|uniref:hypothetical protein n=1 Tax=Paraburkholderia bannensis TaxID=765414 RepID=UPI002AB79036|nr:hypothetical protein [Paraburkholderia bannensis]